MDISWKLEKTCLEKKLEVKNLEMENLQQQLKEVEVQFESRIEEVEKNQSQEVASLKKHVTAIDNKVYTNFNLKILGSWDQSKTRLSWRPVEGQLE